VSQDWPSPQRRDERSSLPRVEDIPLVERGYDPERVEDAFDAFYRHLAQLDSTLRTLETVEAFREQAAELRADLRSIRAAGWSPYPRGYAVAPAAHVGSGVPEAVPRIALEVAFLIVVTVVVAVANLPSWQIVAAMGIALAVTVLVEVLAGRPRGPVMRPAAAPVQPAIGAVVADEQPPVEEPVPAPAVEEEPVAAAPAPAIEAAGWAAYAEPSGPEALTVMEGVSFDEPRAEQAAAAEPQPEDEPAVEVEAEEEALPLAESTEEFAGPDLEEPVEEPVAAAEPVAEPEPEPESAAADVERESELRSAAADAAAVAAAVLARPAEEAAPAPERRGLRLWRRRDREPGLEPEAQPPEAEEDLEPAGPVGDDVELRAAAAAAAHAAAAVLAAPGAAPAEPRRGRFGFRRRAADVDAEAVAEPADAIAEAVEPELEGASGKPEPVAEAPAEPVPEPEPEFDEEPVLVEELTEEGPRRRLTWRRRQRRSAAAREREPDEAPAHEPPKHVRVLPTPEPVLERDLDPWERGFDFDLDDDAVPQDEAGELPLRQPPN
jgi:hypothetical protein